VTAISLSTLTCGIASGEVESGPKNPIQWVRSAPTALGTAMTATSPNWAGYVTTSASSATFSRVKGSWIEPSISCSTPLSPRNDDSFWIGLDGFMDNTVEQTGTEGTCKGTTPKYDAWYEMFPKSSIVAFTIRAGDRISAEVASVGGKFVLTLTDVSSGRRLQRTLSMGLATRSSAEWIAESSSSCSNCLANFGTVTFSDASATSGATTGGISTFSHQAITLVDGINQVAAQPSGLRSGGTSFSVIWKAR
jgi:hypothetical protein